MALIASIAAVLVLVSVPTIQADIQANKADVTFYTKANYGGHPIVITIPETQLCVNLDPCVTLPMSAKWSNLPTRGEGQIAFYAGPDCSGSGTYFPTAGQATGDFASNFKNGRSDGKISSMMLWETRFWYNRIKDYPCIIRWWLE